LIKVDWRREWSVSLETVWGSRFGDETSRRGLYEVS
jgi:hypothetical protein